MTQFQGIDVDACFPYKKADGTASYRPYQKEAILKALNAFVEQDYEVFCLDAPVGFGKSPVILTIERVLAELDLNSYYTTPLIILQDQLEEFEDLPQIKGRGNFICLDNPEVSCANGECQIDDKYKCSSKEQCLYLVQRDKCINSPMCGMNTSYMMAVSQKVFEPRFMFACDEAHSVPEWGNGYVSVSIRESDVKFIPEFPAGFPAYILWLEKMVYPKMKEKVDNLKEQVLNFGKSKRKAMLGLFEEYKAAKELCTKINMLSYDYKTYNEDWTYDIVADKWGNKIVFKPITSGRFLKHILWSRGEKILLSSGTITPEIFIHEGGLNGRAYDSKDCVIEVQSDFNPKKSPIIYKAIGKMTNDYKPFTFPKIINEMNKFIGARTDRKGIIHTFSYENAVYIKEHIAPELRGMMYMQEKDNRSNSLEDWMNIKEPSFFVSTNMTEGLNLKGDSCRYQIYTKIGFSNIKEKRVAKRLELGHWLWYYTQAMEDVEQASGRATRSVDDWSEMVIYDASFATMYCKYNKYLKRWFKDRLVFENV